MDCKGAMNKFVDFIDDKLSVADLEEFLDHMNNCEECREEFEIYYTVIMGMRMLEKNPHNTEINLSSEEKLQSAEKWLKSYKLRRIEKRVTFLLIIIYIILVW
ncbi:MAG: zf-HC2 domain-containing protein [Lachnospiraceae bacterium]|nr:zf-HC2 domain-containing protein [Lachnospiraceae bacterium]